MSGAMVRSAKDKQKTIMDLFESRKDSIKAVLPKHLTPERMLKVALSATARSPQLLACTPQSLLLCVMQAAELGLEAGGILGEAYLVAYKDTATLIPGYRGMIKLARQSGLLSSLEAYVVRKQDLFDIEFGLEPKLTHKPFMQGEPKDDDIVATYAIARFKDGSRQVDVMTRAEVDAIRKRSAAANAGPWVTDFAEMAKKTVIRRLCKYLPLSPELQKAIEHDAAVEMNVASPIIDLEIMDGEVITETAPRDASSTIKDKLDAKDRVETNGVTS